ncbi:MAG: ASPIC/UnbV domain-containing protein [Saprospiraceae bacterium]|nr:ASPIC/UnbV domain-containing protein [Saprospiraceae bacterium]
MTNVRGYMSTSEPLFHFGLAADSKIDSIILRWPDGTHQEFKDVNVNQRMVIKYTEANQNKIEQLDFSTKMYFLRKLQSNVFQESAIRIMNTMIFKEKF